MPLPVIANTARCTLHWVGDSANPPLAINVIHLEASARTEEEMADSIQSALDAEQVNALACLSSAYVLAQVDVIKLDGSSGTQSFGYSGPAGQAGGDYIPQGCMVVSLKTAGRGPQARGRIYIGPVAESRQANGQLTSGADPTAGWSNVLDALSSDSNPLVVASYVHSTKREVTSLTIHNALRTQRRRQAIP